MKDEDSVTDQMIGSNLVKNTDGTPRYVGNDASGVVFAGCLGVRFKETASGTSSVSGISCTGTTTDAKTTCVFQDITTFGYQSAVIDSNVALLGTPGSAFQRCISGGYRRLKAVGTKVVGAFKNKNKPAIGYSK